LYSVSSSIFEPKITEIRFGLHKVLQMKTNWGGLFDVLGVSDKTRYSWKFFQYPSIFLEPNSMILIPL